MSSAPQPGRQKQSPSSNHPPQQMMPARPPPRPAPYPPRYYRSAPPGPSPSPKLGWTPRTAASPHTPLTPRTHSRAPGSASTHHPGSASTHHPGSASTHHPGSAPTHHPGSAPTHHPGSASTHHHGFSQQTPSGSPRLNVSAPGISKPGIKPTLSPIPISPNVSAHTPSWLKGNYKPQTPKTPPAEPATVEQMCAKRLEEIRNTINGEKENPELFDVIQKLEFQKIPEEYQLVDEIHDVYFKARERKRKADHDLFRAELELYRVDQLRQHIDGKIARLRTYYKFIENGWVDKQALQQESPSENGPTSSENTNGDHKREPEDEVMHEAVEQGGVEQEGVNQEGIKQEGIKQEGVKQEGVKQEAVKQEDVKQEDVKQEDVKQEVKVADPVLT